VPLVAGALLGLAALVALPASPATAHSELVSSSPEDGAVLASAPAQVVLSFSEGVTEQGSAVAVTGADDERVDDAGSLSVSGTTVKTALDDTVGSGEYVVVYRVVSVDGHVVDGTLTYRVEPPAEESPTASASATPSAAASSPPSQTSTPAAKPAAAVDDTGGGTPWWPIALGAAALAAVAAVVVSRTRRGRG
jgi:methionine-rich copper-binding protein CopC